jgi:hypothetical protein
MRRAHPATGARIVAAGLSVAAAAGIIAVIAVTDHTPSQPPVARAPAAGAPPQMGRQVGSSERARPGDAGRNRVTRTGAS